MLSCFPCGRISGSVLEPTSTTSKAHKCGPSSDETNSFNEMNKDQFFPAPSCSLTAEVKAYLNMSAHTIAADSKDMDLFSFIPQEKGPIHSVADAKTINSRLAKEDHLAAYPSRAFQQLYCRRDEKELAISTIMMKNSHTQDKNSAKEAKDEYRAKEGKHLSSINIPKKEVIGSKERRGKDFFVSSILALQEEGFIQDKELAPVGAGEAEKSKQLSEKLNPGPAMLGDCGILQCNMLENKYTGIHSLVGKQETVLTKAIPEEGTPGIKCVAGETDIHESPKEAKDALKTMSDEGTQAGEGQNGINMAHEGDIGYDGKGFISQSKEPSRLFSYGISDQQRDFMFLCAGLVIQAVGFQLKSIIEVITALILLGYRVYFFASRIAESLLHTKQKLAETRTMLLSHVATDNIRFSFDMERWESMKPLIIAGAKKMGWSCLNAAYVLAMLSALLFTSFLFSYFAVKGSSTQKPMHIERELYFDYTKSHPVASLDLFSLDAYTRMVNASKCIKVPAASLRYRCTILLTLPESDYNRKLGVFQVTSELLSETGQILVKASQPCMLHFKSNMLHYVKSIFMVIPLLTGVTSETQTLSLHLLEWQQDASANVLRILLVPRAGRAISTGLPELYKSEVQVDSLQVPWMPSSPSSSIRTLVMWIGLSFLVFGCLSSFCIYRMNHNKSTS